eukprot:492432_1
MADDVQKISSNSNDDDRSNDLKKLFHTTETSDISRNPDDSMYLLELQIDKSKSHSDEKKNCELDTCNNLKRLLNIFEIYHTYIEMKQKQRDVEINMNIDDYVYNSTQILNDFHHLLHIHNDQFENIHTTFKQKCNSGNPCTINCLSLRRNYRDRSFFKTHNADLKQLYFNCQESNDISNQQILDKIHCYYLHSFDIAYKLSTTDKMEIRNTIDQKQNETKETDVTNDIVRDTLVLNIGNKVAEKKQKYRDIKELQQLNNDSSKFCTILNDESELMYSYGIRFFYWKWYKDNIESFDPVQFNESHEFEANEGCMLGEFYVETKFKDLKEELTNNAICIVSNEQWNLLVRKAEVHIQTQHFRNTKCRIKDCEKYYEMKVGSVITTIHLIAMMAYTNQTKLQEEFSKTCRRISREENNKALVDRHRNYAQWARLLRENVECFG